MPKTFVSEGSVSKEIDILCTKYKDQRNYKIVQSVDEFGNVSVIMPLSLPKDVMSANMNTIKNADKSEKVKARLRQKLALKK